MCVQEMRLMIREEVAEHVSGNYRALAVMGEAHGGKLPGQADSHGLIPGLGTSSPLDILVLGHTFIVGNAGYNCGCH